MVVSNDLILLIRMDLPDDCELVYVGRSESAITAMGS